MPGVRKQQKAQTRERIIAAAFAVYSKQGFTATTAAIADEAGVSHGSVFVHFLKALEPQIAAGRVKDIPLHMIFNTWLGLVHYYLQNAGLFAPEGSVLTRYKSTLTQTFLALIRQE